MQFVTFTRTRSHEISRVRHTEVSNPTRRHLPLSPPKQKLKGFLISYPWSQFLKCWYVFCLLLLISKKWKSWLGKQAQEEGRRESLKVTECLGG